MAQTVQNDGCVFIQNDSQGAYEYIGMMGIRNVIRYAMIRHRLDDMVSLFIGYIVRSNQRTSFGKLQFRVLEHYVMFM